MDIKCWLAAVANNLFRLTQLMSTASSCVTIAEKIVIHLPHGYLMGRLMMISEIAAKLRRSLIKHEGFNKFPYLDTYAHVTIGIGYNLSERGIDDDWINAQYAKDVAYFYHMLDSTFPWFAKLNEDRQIVLVDMAFMGWRHFLTFEDMLKALSTGDYKQAAAEMISSEWAGQVKSRAKELATAMFTGEYNI